MGWKVIHLTKPCKIKVKDENLLLEFIEDEKKENIKVTISDIDFILFDNPQFSITGKAIELLSKNGIATLFYRWGVSSLIYSYSISYAYTFN